MGRTADRGPSAAKAEEYFWPFTAQLKLRPFKATSQWDFLAAVNLCATQRLTPLSLLFRLSSVGRTRSQGLAVKRVAIESFGAEVQV